MQYADLEGYLEERGHNRNPIYFLEYHAKYPVMEFLWKAGYRNIVHNQDFRHGQGKPKRHPLGAEKAEGVLQISAADFEADAAGGMEAG